LVGLLVSRGFLADVRLGLCGLICWLGVWGLAAQKFVVRPPSLWDWFLCGLVLGELCSSKRGICLEQFRDGGGLA